MRAGNLALRFLLELTALGLLLWWGFSLQTSSIVVRAVAGLAAVGAFAGIWGALVAPKARRRLPDPSRLVLELTLFTAVAVAIAAADAPGIAIVFAGLVILNEVLLFVFQQRAY